MYTSGRRMPQKTHKMLMHWKAKIKKKHDFKSTGLIIFRTTKILIKIIMLVFVYILDITRQVDA